MRVERASVDVVKERLEQIKNKILRKGDEAANKKSALEDYESRLSLQHIENEAVKKKRKEDLLNRKKEQEAKELEIIDPHIAEMMGFSGFGKTKN